jgi:putative endopeptidase
VREKNTGPVRFLHELKERNADGIKPIQGNLNKIDAIKNLKDLQNYLTSVTKEGENNFYGWGVY